MDFVKLKEIELASGKNAKVALLKKLDEDTVRFLRLCLDPRVNFYVTGDEDDHQRIMFRGKRDATTQQFSDRLYNVLLAFSRRELTGHAAVQAFQAVISACPREELVHWACRFLNKKPRLGAHATSLNEAFPGSIEEFEVALAKPYEAGKHELIGSYVSEPKLDGLRSVNIEGTAYSRNGLVIESIGHIVEELMPWRDRFVFDGELMGAGDFDESSGDIRRKGEGPNADIYYNVFDLIDLQGWRNRDTFTLAKRKEQMTELWELEDLASLKHVRLVPWTSMTSPTPQQVFAERDRYIGLGYEGAMLKDMSRQYVWGRSDALLKAKKMLDVDAPVVASFEGKGKHKGKLGGVVVVVDGIETKVGSGFSDEQRVALWQDPDALVGRMIEIAYQNKASEGALRFPVFIKMRPDKE